MDIYSIDPLCDSIIFFTIPRPNPIPEVFVVNLGSKILSLISCDIPSPLSVIDKIVLSVSVDNWTPIIGFLSLGTD